MLVVLVALLSGCVGPGYYLHLLNGQRQLLAQRVPIADVLADPVPGAELKRRLRLVQDARAYASQALGLPANGSYTAYVELDRPYVVWNVFAAPEFSLAPKQWCHLLTGCLAYRGYFEQVRAEAMAGDLKAEGYDVHVGGVPAYSTLGWFDDPVLSSMLHWDDDELIGTIFHELAHQRLFVSGDTAFNESFAKFVEQEGLRRFRRSRNEAAQSPESERRQREFTELVMATRARLETLYSSAQAPQALRAGKRAEIERLRQAYAQLRARWGGYAGYDAWFGEEINNAKLLPIGLYHQWVPAFAALFRAADGQWPAFYRAAERLARAAPEQRQQELAARVAPAEQ